MVSVEVIQETLRIPPELFVFGAHPKYWKSCNASG